jgi:hypothetical protein
VRYFVIVMQMLIIKGITFVSPFTRFISKADYLSFM